MKKIIYKNPFLIEMIALLLLFIMILGIDTFFVRNRIDSAKSGEKYESVGNLKSTEIVPNHNNFNIVILQLKNPGITNSEDFVFRIYSSTGEILRSINFNGKNIGDPGDLRFQFDPITDSGGKTYKVEVTRANSGSEGAVKVNVDSNNNLAYTAYFRVDKHFQAARETILTIFAKVVKDPGFLILWGLCLLIIIIKGYRLK
jgi:hypothetical protein